MAKGRKRLPTEMKFTRGTSQKCRTNPFEPKSPIEAPPAPDWLSERAQAVFMDLGYKLTDMRVITQNDAMALELLATAYDEYRQAKDVIEEQGLTFEYTNIKTGVTTIKAHPAVGIANNAWRRTLSMLSEFGLTPSSRSKVQASGKEEKDALQELLNR